MKLLNVYLVDDEQLALNRLKRLLQETNKVAILGQTTDPGEALRIIPKLKLDALFLDIQMPGLSGFELLRELNKYPPAIFTTAYDKYALEAFEMYSIDYLLKPIESERLEAAVNKLVNFASLQTDVLGANIDKLLESWTGNENAIYRIASRIGGKIQVLDVSSVTHFFAEDKMTFAQNVEGKKFPIDMSLNLLEENLDRRRFVRIHRRAILNIEAIDEVHGWFSGKVLIRLRDDLRTELVVARDRVRVLKQLIGM